MTIKQTSVNVDINKWNILKAKGYKLQDIIEDSFNAILEIEDKEPVELIKEKEDLESKLKILFSEKETAAEDYDDKIGTIIAELEKEKAKALDDIDNKVNEIKLKITAIDNEIANEKDRLKNAEEEATKNKEFNDLFLLLKDYSGNYNNEIVRNKIYLYTEKYDLEPNTVATELVKKYNDYFYSKSKY